MRDQTELLPSPPAVWSFLCTSRRCQQAANLPLQTQINMPLLPLLITAQCTAYGSCMFWFNMTSLLGMNYITPWFPTLQKYLCVWRGLECKERQNPPTFSIWLKAIDFDAIYCMSILLVLSSFHEVLRRSRYFFKRYWHAIIWKWCTQLKKRACSTAALSHKTYFDTVTSAFGLSMVHNFSLLTILSSLTLSSLNLLLQTICLWPEDQYSPQSHHL